MDYKGIASELLNYVGGKAHVAYFEYCSTRLRSSLVDDTKADVAKLESMLGVIAVKMTSQCQLVIGNDVVEVYDEVIHLLGPRIQHDDVARSNQPRIKRKWGTVILDFLTGMFGPLIPAAAYHPCSRA